MVVKIGNSVGIPLAEAPSTSLPTFENLEAEAFVVPWHKDETMKKRTFLKLSGIVGAGTLAGCSPLKTMAGAVSLGSFPYSLPALSYGFTELEPHIDAMTMEIHHDRHHAGYVKNLNAALEPAPNLQSLSIEQLLATIKPEDAALRNNGGGHWNHTMFWQWLTPGSTQPGERLRTAIAQEWGSLEEFQKAFAKAASGQFGSGWAWLCKDEQGKLFITSTPNQDNPLMTKIIDKPGTPILGLDVWEHAYYLHYQNKRADYITAFWNVVNWDRVNALFG